MSLNAKKDSSGFSLIELLVVLAIVGVLAAIGIPIYNEYKIRTAEAVINRNFDFVSSAIDQAFKECEIHGKEHRPLLDGAHQVNCEADNSFGGVKYGLQIPLANYLKDKLGPNPYDSSLPAIRGSGKKPPIGTMHVDYGRAGGQCDDSGRWCVRVMKRSYSGRETRIFFLPNWCNGDSDDHSRCP